LLFAGQDLRAAELAMMEDLYIPACLHCLLCVERAMKALLVLQGRTLPRTHHLADLLALLDPSPLAVPALAVQQLDRFHTAIRYPDAAPGERLEGLPDAEDAREAVAVARETLALIGRVMAEM
jgi:HEPN domain-containing protein